MKTYMSFKHSSSEGCLKSMSYLESLNYSVAREAVMVAAGWMVVMEFAALEEFAPELTVELVGQVVARLVA